MIARIEVMVMMSGMDLPVSAIREMVASAIHMIVQITRFSDGSRRIINITEITGVESGIVSMQDIFKYQQEGFGNVISGVLSRDGAGHYVITTDNNFIGGSDGTIVFNIITINRDARLPGLVFDEQPF